MSFKSYEGEPSDFEGEVCGLICICCDHPPEEIAKGIKMIESDPDRVRQIAHALSIIVGELVFNSGEEGRA
jgi:hypothetical protein